MILSMVVMKKAIQIGQKAFTKLFFPQVIPVGFLNDKLKIMEITYIKNNYKLVLN